MALTVELTREELRLIQAALLNYKVVIGDSRRKVLVQKMADDFESAACELDYGGRPIFKGVW